MDTKYNKSTVKCAIKHFFVQRDFLFGTVKTVTFHLENWPDALYLLVSLKTSQFLCGGGRPVVL